VKPSVNPSHPANDNLINRTREVWSLRVGRDLTGEDARQIVENIVGFFATLSEWSRVEIPAPANDTTKSAPSDPRDVRDES
jgi:hypothetical protein